MEATREEVATHSTPASSWLIIDAQIYNISSFAAMHPGGEKIIRKYAGKDATESFYALHRHEVLDKYARLRIGSIRGESRKILPNTGVSLVPYAEPSYMQGFSSPYYKQSHHELRLAVRQFMVDHVIEEGMACEQNDKPASKELFLKFGEAGLLAMRMGPGAHLPVKMIGGVDRGSFDYFHEMILHEEFCRLGLPGFQDSLATGMVIGLPPVMKFASKSVRDFVVPLVLSGAERICLAISEPTAGSDVAAIQTTAELTSDGKFYIVNGTKKWITGGMSCRFFTTAVQTKTGISMLLIERGEGMETKTIKTSYSSSAGTCLIILEDVKVPVGNLLGAEGQGFLVIMYNFNHERWYICAAVISATRKVLEECYKWTNQRTVFGKKLIEQPVIRAKLAHMTSQLEGVYNWLENITYQMTQMDYKTQSVKLAGPIALLKLMSTRVAHLVSDEACQIFGGRAITKTGMGRYIEAMQRTYKFAAILGGSEEIMADLGIRMASKGFPEARL